MTKNEKDLRELLKREDWEKALKIVRKNPEKFDELLIALKDADPNVRTYTTMCLAELPDSRAVNPLIEALNDSSSDVRFFAAIALGNIGDTSAVDPLIEKLRDDEDPAVRSAAALALGDIGDSKAVEPLINVFKHDGSFVKLGVVSAFEKFGDERSVSILQEFLKTETDKHVRDDIYRALERLRADKVIKRAESATQELEKLREEEDIAATVSVKISEIIDPLKEDLEKYKEEKDQEIKERFKAYDEQFQFFHEELAPFRKVTRERITKEVGYSELNARLNRFEEMLSKTNSRVDKLFESLPEYMQAGFNKWMAWAAIIGLFATIILLALQLTGVLPPATSSGT